MTPVQPTLVRSGRTANPRVAAVPARHPYVQHLGAEAELLPDPPGTWWPPEKVDAAWIDAHADTFDLMHLHFGTESFSVAHLEAAVQALRRAGRPLVYTVHDLDHPQLADQRAHAEHLDLLVAAADALVTLTPGAAAVVQRRWGRRATVVPHPHVVPFAARLPVGTASGPIVAGVHLRDLRPNIDGPGTVARLLEAAQQAGDVAVRVFMHDRVRDERAAAEVRRLCAAPQATLVEGPRPTDHELAVSIADLDVAVLPYARGTHSGWLELCWDLGVPVATAAVGFVAEQHPVSVFDGSGALAAALVARCRPGSLGRHALQRARRADRREAARHIGAAHDAIYAAVLAR